MKFVRGYYDIFVRTCAKYPTNIAVRQYENESYKLYTYSELYGVCEYIAQNLLQLPSSKSAIGLVSDRNVIIPCVIAAAHKCCTTFMFLNPTLEMETVAVNMNFHVIIKIVKEGDVPAEESEIRKPNKTISVFGYAINFYYYNVLEGTNSYKYIQDHSYVAMTSGSTGEPKHIQVPIQCLQPNIDDLTKLFQVTSTDVVYFSTPLTFDPSMVEILLACMNGASLLVAPDKPEILFPKDRSNSVTIWQITPSRFFQFTIKDLKTRILCANSTLRILAFGGEPFNGVKKLKEIKDEHNNTKIFTLYGVTEMSCWACVTEVDLAKLANDAEIPLGHCLSETEIMIQPAPGKQDSNHGKIVLVSKSRKCILLNTTSNGQKESHALKFIDTGDVGEVKKGLIYYRGRKDDFIKRFGHKINLQHIEYTVMQCPRIKACSCVWLPKPTLLVVYFSSETLSSKELSDFLRCKLDDKHWPDKVIRVDNMPMSAHGKISKCLLSKLYENFPTASQTMQSIKLSFLQELKSTLGAKFTYDDVKDKDFFTLGGTSFLAVSLCNRVSQINNHFGKLILPYLISPKNTIDEIMKIAEKEINVDIVKRNRLKRFSSDTDLNGSSSSKQMSMTTYAYKNPINFAVQWSYDTGKCVDGSPTLLQNYNDLYVVVGSHSGKVIVFNARSGAKLGAVKVAARVEAAVCCARAGAAECCGVVGAYDGTVVCFLLDSCRETWRINIGTMVKSKATCCNGNVYVAAYDGNIRCIDMKTGEVKETIFVTEQAISADLVLAKNEYILTGTLSGVCASVHVSCAGSHSVAWRGTVSSPIFASPVLYDADRYVVFAEVNGEIHCRTVEKGIKIWKFQGAKGNIFSSIYVREVSKLKWQMVFGCHDSKVYSINVKNFQPSLHWKTQLNAPVYSTPCRLSNNLLLAASKNGALYGIEAETGEILSEHHLPNETFSSPVVFQDFIFIGCRDDHMYCISYHLNKA